MPEPDSVLRERPLSEHPFPPVPEAIYEIYFKPHADPGCPFCQRIAAGEYDAYMGRTVWDHEVQARVSIPGAVTFEPLNPVVPGHRLFVPVKHVQSAATDALTTAETMWAAATWLAPLAMMSDASANIITSIGVAATQTVRHLHIHAVPRRHGDGLKLPWTDQPRP